MRPKDRERIQAEVVSRVVQGYMRKARLSPEGFLETAVNDTLYHEKQRLDKARASRAAKGDLVFYQKIQHRLRHATERNLKRSLEQLARRFVAEIVGNFDERVYRFSTTVIPPGMWALLTALSPQRLLSLGGTHRRLSDHLRVTGEVEHARQLLEHGTLIVVPTHSSNLDSIVLGYAGYLIGLPPLTYGAGINLFSNPLISFFMRNLGAYRVDRKKSAPLYKEILKEYATCSLEMGYHNLFFPGGTRSRSGIVEQKLKLGLLGTSLRAYIGNLMAGKPKPNIYIVPCTISYKLVLEAETLIDDHLKETGKSRYIIEDDEFSRPRQVINFLGKLLSLDSRIAVTFSRPLDVLGHQVDHSGQSLDRRGRRVELKQFVSQAGQPVFDDQRDTQYIRELGGEICRTFLRDNMIMSTNILAFALWSLLEQHNPGLDLYRLLRTGGAATSFSMAEVHTMVERLLTVVRQLEDGPRLGRVLENNDIQEIVNDALKHFSLYHSHPAARRQGDRIFHEDRNLLLYYRNRLRGYNLGRKLEGNRQIWS